MQIDTGPPWIPNVFSAKKKFSPNKCPQCNLFESTALRNCGNRLITLRKISDKGVLASKPRLVKVEIMKLYVEPVSLSGFLFLHFLVQRVSSSRGSMKIKLENFRR